jgi:diacylglycerol kinase family enzyme
MLFLTITSGLGSIHRALMSIRDVLQATRYMHEAQFKERQDDERRGRKRSDRAHGGAGDGLR